MTIPLLFFKLILPTNLNSFFNFHICLSFCPFLSPSICPKNRILQVSHKLTLIKVALRVKICILGYPYTQSWQPKHVNPKSYGIKKSANKTFKVWFLLIGSTYCVAQEVPTFLTPWCLARQSSATYKAVPQLLARIYLRSR